MRAVRIEGPGEVAIRDVPEPVVGAGEVIVHVRAVAACGTDLRISRLGSHAPRIPGHEIVGTLDDGTLVGVQPNLGCGACAACRDDRENRCAAKVDIGIQRDGGAAERLAVPAAHVVPLGDFPVLAAPQLESLACVLHAVDQLAVVDGEPVVVIGAGAIGILAAWTMRSRGARVAVVQRSEGRRATARGLDVGAVLAPDDDVEAALGAPPVAAFVAAGGVEPLTWALERVAIGGRIHAFAGTPGGAPIDANLVHYRHLALLGSTGSTVADYRRGLALARSGAVPVERLPTREVAFDELPAVLRGERTDPSVLKYVTVPG